MSAVLIIKPTEPIPGHLHREGVVVTPQEAVIYDELIAAAEAGQPCPDYLDLNEAANYSSSSSSPKVVTRLERKGLIQVERHRRYRIVTITATGKGTAAKPGHRPAPLLAVRGTHDPRPLFKALVEVGIGEELADEIAADQAALMRCERLLNRALELVVRRKIHYLTAGGQ